MIPTFDEAKIRLRQALDLPESTKFSLLRANFSRVQNQKYYLHDGKRPYIATFFCDSAHCKKEVLINSLVYKAFCHEPYFCPAIVYQNDDLLVREYVMGDVLDAHRVTERGIKEIAGMLVLLGNIPTPDELKDYRHNFDGDRSEALLKILRARRSFAAFKGSDELFRRLESELLSFSPGTLESLDAGFIHGDFQPRNILVNAGSYGIIDFDWSGYGHPLYDLASFAIQFEHFQKLSITRQASKSESLEITHLIKIFCDTAKEGSSIFDLSRDENKKAFRFFTLLILFRGLSYSTGDFNEVLSAGSPHLLYEILDQYLQAAVR